MLLPVHTSPFTAAFPNNRFAGKVTVKLTQQESESAQDFRKRKNPVLSEAETAAKTAEAHWDEDPHANPAQKMLSPNTSYYYINTIDHGFVVQTYRTDSNAKRRQTDGDTANLDQAIKDAVKDMEHVQSVDIEA